MKLNMYQVDAFSKGLFTGNPAAVCPLPSWIEPELMQKIACENNLSETSFFVDNGDHFSIRWFTPSTEVKLCGHATLATGFVLHKLMDNKNNVFEFHSASGILKVICNGNKYTLDFPSDKLERIEPIEALEEALQIQPVEIYKGIDDYMVILDRSEEVKNLSPNFRKLANFDARGVIATAPGENVDFISRGFFPAFGIDEDPATGSAHTSLTPFWSKKLNKKKLNAIQWSQRKGYFECEYLGDRCLISGECQLYLKGTITI
jgi:PhzF family phenazine biosynthesis protein